jgi:hypothetical protein
MSFVGVTKKCGQNSKVHYLLTIHDFDLIFLFLKFDYDSFKYVSPFFIISMDLILFIFLYLRNVHEKLPLWCPYKVTVVCKHLQGMQQFFLGDALCPIQKRTNRCDFPYTLLFPF